MYVQKNVHYKVVTSIQYYAIIALHYNTCTIQTSPYLMVELVTVWQNSANLSEYCI